MKYQALCFLISTLHTLVEFIDFRWTGVFSASHQSVSSNSSK